MSTRLAGILATVGGLGDRLPAPGTTVGSPVALAAYVALAAAAPALAVTPALAAVVPLAALAVWACGVEAARRGEADPGAIVLDEVAGQWLALALVAAGLGRPPRLGEAGAAFVAFRLLDVLKPWPIRWFERLPGGWGITADDLAAGAAAAVLELAALRLV